jgi:hypothetical protein
LRGRHPPVVLQECYLSVEVILDDGSLRTPSHDNSGVFEAVFKLRVDEGLAEEDYHSAQGYKKDRRHCNMGEAFHS